VLIEGTTSGIVAVVDGAVVTAPDGEELLTSTTVMSIIERAHRLGIAVRREFVSASGPWDGLYIASATRDIAPVVELDGEPLGGWDPVGHSIAAMG